MFGFVDLPPCTDFRVKKAGPRNTSISHFALVVREAFVESLAVAAMFLGLIQ